MKQKLTVRIENFVFSINNFFVKNYKLSAIQLIIGFVLIIKYISFLVYPYLGVDGPWSLSSVYSYINGVKDRSVFAHDFLDNVFTVHIIDFFYTIWFKIFGLNTYSFISFGFVVILFTIILWGYIATKLKEYNFLFYLLMFAYVVSPYVYGFRPENLIILTISGAIFLLVININQNLKALLISILCVFSGLIHHIGGLICLIIFGYYYLIENKNYFNFIKFTVFGILFSFILTNGEIFNYLLLPFKFKSEVDNHLSSLNFYNVIKYFIYSGPIPVLIIFLFRKALFRKDIIFLIFLTLLFSFLGRSYYVSYIYVVILFLLVIRKTHFNNFVKPSKIKINSIFTLITLYSFIFLFLIPVFLIFSSPSTNKTWRTIISSMKNEKSSWEVDKKYFVPAQLTLEVASEQNARLLYPFMLRNEGIQNTENIVIYINKKEQLKWIEKNFLTKNKKMIIEEVVKKQNGNIMISSIYKFKIKRTEPIGLWKISFINQD